MSKSNKYQPTKIEPIENINVNEEGFVIEGLPEEAQKEYLKQMEKATEENQTIKPEREIKTTRKRSEIDTIKRFQKWIVDLSDSKMITEDEKKSLQYVAERMTTRWLGYKINN